jgi:sacsin
MALTTGLHIPTSKRPFGSPFGQQVRLTVKLRGLVRDYPQGIGILKEFIQNADDAGASHVRILLDWCSYPTERLPEAAMAPLAGPALIISNDQLFTPQDMDSIQDVGMGTKGMSASKTGRFGLGFNACYNVTDYPMLLTGDSLCFFDPHHNRIPGATSDRPGWTVKLDDPDLANFPDLLAPFVVAGYEMGSRFYDGTAFRLPLRTREQAAESEISNRPFTRHDFQNIVEKLTPVGAEMLIFLKHVLSLSVEEMEAGGRASRTLLEIQTENVEEVSGARQVVLDAVDEDVETTLAKLETESFTRSQVQFDHRIRVQHRRYVEVQTWRIVSGLYVDEGGELLATAREMLKNQEKALPWAGAACRIDCEAEHGRPSRNPLGKLYCFLPLSAPTGMPVHLNGFFDLDSSRHTLTADSGSTGAAALRVKWNELLVQQCVAQAYADLIAACAQDLGVTDPKAFYRLWPVHSVKVPGPLSVLAERVYACLASRPVVPLAGRKQWTSINRALLLPRGAEPNSPGPATKVYQPLVLDGMLLADRTLPSYIEDGFRAAGVDVTSLQPRHVRDRLRVDSDVNCIIEEALRPCLRRRQFVVELLRFCYRDDQPKDLMGVPLLLMADGRLHTIGHHPYKVAYIASERERRLFGGFPQWFVDPDFAEEAGVRECSDTHIYKYDPATVLGNLHWVLNPKKVPTPVTWDPQSPEPPNSQWLEDVYDYLASKIGPQFNPSKDSVEKIPMVPDQVNRLWSSGKADTPLLVSPGDEPAFVQALTLLEIPLVAGTQQLLNAIARFKEKASASFYIWGLTARDVADTLHALKDRWEPKALEYDPSIHEPIMDFYSHPRQLKDLRSSSVAADRVSKLKSMPLFLTEDGAVVTGDANAVYLPSNDYQPPAVALSVRLLKTGKNNRWRDFLEILSFPELDRPRLIQDVLLPSYVKLDPQQQYQVLSWIRDNLSAAETQLEKRDPAKAKALHTLVAEAELVRCTDGKVHPGRLTYDPASAVVRTVLGEAAWIPDMKCYEEGADSWLRFFKSLDMSDSPRADDILSYVDLLTAEAKVKGSISVAERAAVVFDHVVEHWDRLSKTPVRPAGTKVPVLLGAWLTQRAWLPAQRDPKRLANYLGATIPPDRLYKPSELYMARHARLVCSQSPVAAIKREPDGSIRRALAIPESPDVQTVIKHSDRILSIWEAGQGADVTEESLVASLNEIYRYFGTVKDPSTIRLLRQHYGNRECLWDPSGSRLWKPEHVFAEVVRLLEPRRIRLQFRQAPDRDGGYSALGRRESPTVQDYIDLLEEIGAEYSGATLPPPEVETVLRVLDHVGEDLSKESRQCSVLQVLTEDCQLVSADRVFENDAPWYAEKLEAGKAHLLHPQIGRNVILRAEIKSLARSITEWLQEVPLPSRKAEALSYCSRWQDTLRDERFTAGLLRLMRVVHPAARIDELAWLTGVNVRAVKAIQTELRIGSDGSAMIVGEAETPQYFDPDGLTIYLKTQPRQLMLSFLATALNQQLDQHHLTDKMVLRDIIDTSPEEIDRLLTRLKVPRFQEGGSVVDAAEADDVSDEFEDEVDQEPETPDEELLREELPEEPYTGEAPGFEGDGAALSSGGLASLPPDLPEGEEPATRPGTEGRATTGSAEPAEAMRERSAPPTGREHERDASADGSRSGQQHSRMSGTAAGNRESAAPGSRPGQHDESGQDTQQSSRTGSHVRDLHQGARPQDRLLSYVAPPAKAEERAPDPTDDEEQMNLKIGDAAVQRVVAFETGENRTADDSAHRHNTPGYDIRSVSTAGEVRYIEVKGVSGLWDRAGVPMSPTQFRFAQDHPESAWLYVVEFALNPETAKVHPIKDPAGRVSQFRFDGGWKAVALGTHQGPSEPASGMSVILSNGAQAEIMSVEPGGAFRNLILRMPDGSQVRKLWQPAGMQLLWPEGEDHNG